MKWEDEKHSWSGVQASRRKIPSRGYLTMGYGCFSRGFEVRGREGREEAQVNTAPLQRGD